MGNHRSCCIRGLGSGRKYYMRLSDLITGKPRYLITEGLAIGHILQILTSKKSRWPDRKKDPAEIREWIKAEFPKYDPTGQTGKYAIYLATQMAKAKLVFQIGREEDGQRFRETMTWFQHESTKRMWGDLVVKHYQPAAEMPPAEALAHYRNIQHFDSWRNVEHIMVEVEAGRREGNGEDTEQVGESANYKMVFEMQVGGNFYRAYEILEPEAFSELSPGTRWCTGQSHNRTDAVEFTYPSWHRRAGVKRLMKEVPPPASNPENKYPSNYINSYIRHRHWIVYLSENKGPLRPFYQFGGPHFHHHGDDPVTRLGINTDYFLGKWAEADPKGPIAEIARIRKHWRPNPKLPQKQQAAIRHYYESGENLQNIKRPPIIEPEKPVDEE